MAMAMSKAKAKAIARTIGPGRSETSGTWRTKFGVGSKAWMRKAGDAGQQ
jgi:hypothetical protein